MNGQPTGGKTKAGNALFVLQRPTYEKHEFKNSTSGAYMVSPINASYLIAIDITKGVGKPAKELDI